MFPAPMLATHVLSVSRPLDTFYACRPTEEHKRKAERRACQDVTSGGKPRSTVATQVRGLSGGGVSRRLSIDWLVLHPRVSSALEYGEGTAGMGRISPEPPKQYTSESHER